MREDRVKSRASGVTEKVSRVSLVIIDWLPSAVTCFEPTVWHTLVLLAWKGLGTVCIGQFMILQLFPFTEGATLICTAVYCSEQQLQVKRASPFRHHQGCVHAYKPICVANINGSQ